MHSCVRFSQVVSFNFMIKLSFSYIGLSSRMVLILAETDVIFVFPLFSLQAKYVINRFSVRQAFSPTPPLYILAVATRTTDIQTPELNQMDGVPPDLTVIFCSIFKKNITLQKLRLWVIKSKRSGAAHIRSNTVGTVLLTKIAR